MSNENKFPIPKVMKYVAQFNILYAIKIIKIINKFLNQNFLAFEKKALNAALNFNDSLDKAINPERKKEIKASIIRPNKIKYPVRKGVVLKEEAEIILFR